MADVIREQKERMSSFIDRLFPNYPLKATMMDNLANKPDEYSQVAEMSDEPLEEYITFEKQYMDRQ